MADYKILQNIDLAQNEIKEVSKIANDREDGNDKGLLIQTGNDTSLAFNRKIKNKDTGTITFNSIKGTVKDGTEESVLNLKPSEVRISHTKGTTSSSGFVLGLDSKGKEHIEAVSPLVDIKTGGTDYTDPHISLKKDISTLGLQSNTVEIKSKVTTESSLKMNEGITGVSNNILLKDSSENVSLNLKSNGTIVEKANTSITETVGTRSVLLNTEGIKIEDSTTSTNTPSIIEVNNDGIKASKTSTINNNDGSKDSYIDIQSNTIEEKSRNVTIKTPDSVTLILDVNTDKTKSSASLTSTGKITLTSQGDAKTEYGNNTITTKADTITIKAKSYTETEATKYYPHIELESNASKNSVLLEGKTIDISSKDKDSNAKDTITLRGTKLNVESTTTEITSDNIHVGENGGILSIDTTTSETTPSITIPPSTVTDIDSKTIGLGKSGSTSTDGSTTTVSGSNFNVETTNTNIISPTITVSGTTTIQNDSSSPANTIEVNGTSTLIKGNKADIKSTDVNIGTETTNNIIIGRNVKGASTPTTTLQSSTTNITSPTLNVDSGTVDFKGTNQNVTFIGKGNSSVTSKVPTYIKDTTFSVDKTTDSSITEVFKVDTSNKSTTINGNTSTIESTDVNIGITTTNAITIGRNATGTSTPTTTLQSNTTNITSPTINIGTSDSSTSVSIGKDSSTVSLKGNHNLSIDTNDTTSKVQANDLKFNTSLSSNDIKVYWDSTLNSLVFAKA